MPRLPVVVVVEDQAELGLVIRDVLGREGFEVVPVPDRDAAMSSLDERAADLLVCDLPQDASVEEVLDPLEHRFPELGIIVVCEPSAVPIPFFGPWRLDGRRLILRRPFRLDDLVAAARQLIA